MQAVNFTHDDIGYVFCGAGWEQGSKTAFRDGYAYDWLNDQWLTLSLFPGESMFGGVAQLNPNSVWGTSVYIGLGGTALNAPGWMPTETSAQWWRYVPGGIAGIAPLPEGATFHVRTNSDELILTWAPCEGDVILGITDVLGRQLHPAVRFSGRSGAATLPTSLMASGVALVEWRTSAQRQVRRVVIE
jgi:hypothetical protein